MSKNGKQSKITTKRCNTVELLKKLAHAHGISGSEKEVSDIMKSELSGLATFKKDNLGSVTFEFKGKTERPKIMFIAHMDEKGFIVKDLMEDGFIKFQCVGTWAPDNMFSSPIEIINLKNEKIPGFIAAGPTSFQENPPKNPPIKNMYIDIGATSR